MGSRNDVGQERHDTVVYSRAWELIQPNTPRGVPPCARHRAAARPTLMSLKSFIPQSLKMPEIPGPAGPRQAIAMPDNSALSAMLPGAGGGMGVGLASCLSGGSMEAIRGMMGASADPGGVSEVEVLGSPYYGHGGFMGAAPQMMADPCWRQILSALMFDVFATTTAHISRGGSDEELIPMLENNPVMCAYGVWQNNLLSTAAGADSAPVMEWDVFVQDDLVELFHATTDPNTAEHIIESILDTMLIAHGKGIELAAEQYGLHPDIYGASEGLLRTALGGVQSRDWMDLFGRALQLCGAGDLSAEAEKMRHEDRNTGSSAATQGTFANTLTFREVVDIYTELLEVDQFSVVLDLKSSSITPALLEAMILALNARGVHIEGVGSFSSEQLEGVSDIVQNVNGQEASTSAILFFHSVHGVLNARPDALHGKDILFNGASLLRSGSDGAVSVRDDLVRSLRQVKDDLDLDVGIYVQEFNIDAEAVSALSTLVNTESDLFTLGFAWGGINGQAATDPSGQQESGQLGYGTQSALGVWEAAKR